MSTDHIWSCYVTEEANLETFYFVLILHLILESHKISSGKALYSKLYQAKTSRVPLGLSHRQNIIISKFCLFLVANSDFCQQWVEILLFHCFESNMLKLL